MSKIIRTPTTAKGGITADEKRQMDALSKVWIERAFRTTRIEPNKIVPAIEALYAAADLKKPRVVIVSSPLVMAFSYGAAAAIWHVRRGDDATSAATYDATSAATYDATSAATRVATYDATFAVTYAATYGATDDATRAATACYTLGGPLGLECAKKWSGVYQGGNMWAPYASYLAAARDVLGLRLEAHEKYAAWEEAAIHGGFRVLHPEFCIVSDFPEVLKVDAENRPHCETGPSHRWRDGWSLYHWHGVKIPGEWIEDKASLTAAKALTWENVEQRRAACEILGWNAVLEELGAMTIDRDEDPEIGELVEVSIPDIGRERFLRVTCGTGRQFALPVPPTMKTALEANAWTYDFDGDVLRKLEVRT